MATSQPIDKLQEGEEVFITEDGAIWLYRKIDVAPTRPRLQLNWPAILAGIACLVAWGVILHWFGWI